MSRSGRVIVSTPSPPTAVAASRHARLTGTSRSITTQRRRIRSNRLVFLKAHHLSSTPQQQFKSKSFFLPPPRFVTMSNWPEVVLGSTDVYSCTLRRDTRAPNSPKVTADAPSERAKTAPYGHKPRQNLQNLDSKSNVRSRSHNTTTQHRNLNT